MDLFDNRYRLIVKKKKIKKKIYIYIYITGRFPKVGSYATALVA